MNAASLHPLKALSVWRSVTVKALGDAAMPDLTARQLGLLLTVYLSPPPHTVRSLADGLDLPKPAVTRALDALGRAGLVRRQRDPRDRRNVILHRTVAGSVFLRDLGDTIAGAFDEATPYDSVFRQGGGDGSSAAHAGAS